MFRRELCYCSDCLIYNYISYFGVVAFEQAAERSLSFIIVALCPAVIRSQFAIIWPASFTDLSR